MTRFDLSLAAVDILSQTLDVDARQFPLEIPSFGDYVEDRKRIATAVFTDLNGRGLIRDGDIVPDLQLALRTLSDYRVAVSAMGRVERKNGSSGRDIFARAAAVADAGVLAVQEGQLVHLELIRPTALAITMVGLLPEVAGGPGQSVTVTRPAAEFGGGDYFGGVRPSRGADQAMRLAESYLRHPQTGSGFFVVSGRDRNGKERRAGEVSWFDTEVGRYLMLSRPPGEDGQQHSTLSPADPPRLIQQLGELIGHVAPRP
jgi:cold shock CspA family protein